jgi:Rod binding domain-containing protein
MPRIPTIPPSTAAANAPALRRAATEFEAQAIAAMFRPIFETVSTDGPFRGGSAEAHWRPMLVDAIARDFARRGGIGIGDAVFRELMRAQETPHT